MKDYVIRKSKTNLINWSYLQNWIPLKGALELWQAAIFALSVGVELRVKENVASLKLQRGMEDIYDALIQNSRYSNICTLREKWRTRKMHKSHV